MLRDLSVTTVAEKWDVSRTSLRRFLEEHGTSVSKIKYDYRSSFIKKHLKLGYERKDIARILGITLNHLYINFGRKDGFTEK